MCLTIPNVHLRYYRYWSILETNHDQNIVSFDLHQTLYWKTFYGKFIVSYSILVKPYNEDAFFLWILTDNRTVSFHFLIFPSDGHIKKQNLYDTRYRYTTILISNEVQFPVIEPQVIDRY